MLIEKVLVFGLGSIILGACIALVFANDLASNLFGVVSLIFIGVLVRLIWMWSRPAKKPSSEVHYGEPDETIWPPPPKQL